MKLLLVEDHEINLKLLRATLQAEGVETLEAADGLEAMAALSDLYVAVDRLVKSPLDAKLATQAGAIAPDA